MYAGIDCATRLTAATASALKSAGITHVGRYLGPESNWKTMQKAEAQAILAAGLNIWSTWETNPTYAGYFSAAQGESDARTAAAYAQSVGQPKGTAIYHSVDYDAQPADYPRILEHFRSIKAANTGYKVGAYGSYGVLTYLNQHSAADYYWQTYAWSGGFLASFANLYQCQNDVTVGGVNVDRDRILLDPGGWQQTMSTLLQEGSTGDAVKTLQQELNTVLGIKLTVDGDFGPKTEAAVKSFQQQYHLSVDGIVGPQTESALKAAYAAKTGATSKVQQAITLITQAQTLLKEVE
ncbi:hypothetical protein AAC03nite_24710 [Alicyclobacillus acidoterrestris]|nr:hypothetical protein AAC03nite_24710 [Alicyclobacillus acidoterrestris]